MLELYQAYTDYEGMMELTESLFRSIAMKVCKTEKVTAGGNEIDLGVPFGRISMLEAVKKYSGVDFLEFADLNAARDAAKAHHIEFEQRHKWGDILNRKICPRCMDKNKIIKRFATFLAKYRVYVVLSVAALVVSSALGVIPLFMRYRQICKFSWFYNPQNDDAHQRERIGNIERGALFSDLALSPEWFTNI